MANTAIIIDLLIIVSILLFLTIIVVLFKNWRNIVIRIWPERYAEVAMIQVDDAIIGEVIKKNDTLTWDFGGNDYFLYYPPPELTKDEEKKKEGETEEQYKERLKKIRERSKSTVFRSNGIASFTFIEGNPWPIDFRDLKKDFTNTTRIQKEFAKVKLSQMVSSVNEGFMEDRKTLVMIAIIVILALILLFRKPEVVISKEVLDGVSKPLLFMLPLKER